MSKTRLIFILFLMFLTACQSNPSPVAISPQSTVGGTSSPISTDLSKPTQSPLPETDLQISVNLSDPRQTILDAGAGDFIHRFSGSDAKVEAVGSYNLANIPMRHARVSIDLDTWEPENDNNDPRSTDMAKFQDSGNNHNVFLFMQDLQAQGFEITASIWDVPDWMVSNPDASSARLISPQMYDEVAESIAFWLFTARYTYGVEVSYVSFNESNIGINVYWTPADYIEFIRVANTYFKAHGVETRWLLGDTSNISDTLWYVQAIWNVEDIRPSLGPLAFHSWDENAPDDALENIAEFALQNDLAVYCTEAGWDPSLWNTPEMFPTWENGLHLARIYTRVIKLSRAEVLMYWQMLGFDYNINNGEEAYSIFYVVQQFAQELPPGTQVFGTSQDEQDVYSFAARRPDGSLVMFLVNTNQTEKSVLVEGLPDGSYSLIRTSKAETREVVAEPVVADSRVLLELAPFSVNVLKENE
jgi:hypothetical protein